MLSRTCLLVTSSVISFRHTRYRVCLCFWFSFSLCFWFLSLFVVFRSRVFHMSLFRWQLGVTVEKFAWISREGRCSYLQRHRSSPVLICRKHSGTGGRHRRQHRKDRHARCAGKSSKTFQFVFLVISVALFGSTTY